MERTLLDQIGGEAFVYQAETFARYKGKCPLCLGAIQPGDYILGVRINSQDKCWDCKTMWELLITRSTKMCPCWKMCLNSQVQKASWVCVEWGRAQRACALSTSQRASLGPPSLLFVSKIYIRLLIKVPDLPILLTYLTNLTTYLTLHSIGSFVIFAIFCIGFTASWIGCRYRCPSRTKLKHLFIQSFLIYISKNKT